MASSQDELSSMELANLFYNFEIITSFIIVDSRVKSDIWYLEFRRERERN
jgi:hypothetical protein